jgi:translation initiation factor 1A
MDRVVRMGRIPGSKKKKMWIHEDDVVIASPWEIQDSKADVAWKYTRPQSNGLNGKATLSTDADMNVILTGNKTVDLFESFP